MTSPSPSLPNGLQNIALSFSGGGYRAATFTLGCVSFLNRTLYEGKPLLHKVRFISSASGGTITNLVLCSMLREGATFEAIYKHLVEQMTGCRLVDEVFAILNDEAAWASRPDKTRNFINAFSMIYDRDLFKGKTFDIMWQNPGEGLFVIEETCTNTTEFNNGLNFRFGTRGDMGNDFLHFNTGGLAAARKIKLADILACSSCFTAGFEPVMYPRDFTWKGEQQSLTKEELSRAMFVDDVYTDSKVDAKDGVLKIGFMDGGIDDNQGIYAFTLADNRKKGYEYDLYMPCDVSSNYLKNPFRYPEIKEVPGLRLSVNDWLGRIKKIRNRYILGIVLLLIVSVALFFLSPAAGWLLLGIFLAAVALPLGVYLFLKKKVKAIQQQLFPPSTGDQEPGMYELVFKKHVGAFLKMPVRDLLSLLAARGKSVVLLATTVFLKKIRRSSYSELFKEKSIDALREVVGEHNKAPQAVKIETGRLWNDHIAMTAVYQLSAKNAPRLEKDLQKEPWDDKTETFPGSGQLLDDLLIPSQALRDVVDIATEMDTTLWFDASQTSKRSLESLVAAGQATICFNLLRVSYRFGNDDNDWMDLRKKLVEDWQRFKEDPYWLYNEYGRTAGLEGFRPVDMSMIKSFNHDGTGSKVQADTGDKVAAQPAMG